MVLNFQPPAQKFIISLEALSQLCVIGSLYEKLDNCVCVCVDQRKHQNRLFVHFLSQTAWSERGSNAVIIVNESSGTGKQWHLLPGDKCCCLLHG